MGFAMVFVGAKGVWPPWNPDESRHGAIPTIFETDSRLRLESFLPAIHGWQSASALLPPSNYPEPSCRPGSWLTALQGGVPNRYSFFDDTARNAVDPAWNGGVAVVCRATAWMAIGRRDCAVGLGGGFSVLCRDVFCQDRAAVAGAHCASDAAHSCIAPPPGTAPNPPPRCAEAGTPSCTQALACTHTGSAGCGDCPQKNRCKYRCIRRRNNHSRH